jgi:predicted peptidase
VAVWPADVAAAGPVPTIIFLHGRGERGAGGAELPLVAKWGLPKFREEPRALTDGPFPFLVAAPQCPADRSWSDAGVAAAVERMIDRLIADRLSDPRRIIVSGFSLGGIGAFWLAVRQPDRYAALVSVCGRCPVEDAPQRLAHLLMWIAYAEDDEFTDLTEGSKRVIGDLSSLGRIVARPYRIGNGLFASAHARTADAAFAEPELYRWLQAVVATLP